MKKILNMFAVVLMLSFVGMVYAQDSKTSANKATEITSQKYFNSLQSKVAVIMFSMDKCAPCYIAKTKFLPQLVETFANEENVGVYILNISHDEVSSDEKDLRKALSIKGTPTFAVVVNGTSVFTQEGYPTNDVVAQERIKDKIIKAVEKYK